MEKALRDKHKSLRKLAKLKDKAVQEILSPAFRKARVRTRLADKKITIASDVVISKLEAASNFPSIEALNEFQKQVLDVKIGIASVKKSVSMVRKSIPVIRKLQKAYVRKCLQATRSKDFSKQRLVLKMFYGRVSSIVKSLANAMIVLQEAKQCLKNTPKLKQLFTACIIGFPNVGKTTLFYKLTGSKAKIANYAFTTLSVNVGYVLFKGVELLQVVDAPGTLNRIDKMNDVELQAWIAAKLSNIIVYVFDPEEQFSLEQQLKLRQRIVKIVKPLNIEIVDYVSKSDKFDVQAFAKRASLKHYYSSPEALKQFLVKKALERGKI